MDDIWDEKPLSEVWAKFLYPVKSEDDALTRSVYDANDMDAWLERVQEEHAKSDGSNFVYFSILNNIRKFAEGQRMLQSVTHQQIANQILKILEPFLVSEFKLNSDKDEVG